MNDSKIQEAIAQNLASIEETQQVKIILAIESGSRAWDFASQDSDYDVRFIYVRTPSDYMRIRRYRDVIELPIHNDLDINGWDIQKALGLLAKSNPPLLEWLSSPIRYKEHDAAANIVRDAAIELFDPVKTAHHYLSMALKNYEYLRADMVKRKKYLYVLRPLFCLDWILENRTMPPMIFHKLVEHRNTELDQQLLFAIERLLAAKVAGKETDKQPKDPVLDQYIQQRLKYYQSVNFGTARSVDHAYIEQIFKDVLAITQP